MIRPILRHLKTRRRDRVIAQAFGRLDPDRVRVPGAAATLRVNPRDGRVRKILLYDIARGRSKTNQVFWLDAVAALDPTLVVDVGLNYGECLLSPKYREGVRLHGFEANPALVPYLNDTIAAHPNRDAITLHAQAVGETTGQTVHLAVDADWSGTSHLSAGPSAGTVAVQSVRPDDVLPRPSASDRLLLKIDIEGFEPLALAGLPATLDAVGSAVVLMEFSPELLADRGHDVPAFWGLLCERFTIHVCGRTGEATPIAACDWAEVPARLKSSHYDLILTIGEDPRIETFLAQWRTRDGRRAAA